MVNVRVDIDQSEVFAMVNTFTRGLREAEKFVAKETERVIRNNIFDDFVRLLAARAGSGWTRYYTDHLIAVMRATIPIQTYVSEGILEIGFDLENLGDWNDLERGAHYRALIEGNDGGHAHHGLNPHPAQIDLPYAGQGLINDDSGGSDYNGGSERRKEFWEQVVIGGDLSFPLGLRKGKGNWTYGELAAYMGYPPIDSYEEITFKRTIAWGGKAPQWLWLENGFNDSEPEINPVDFLRSIELVTECVAREIYEGEIIELVRLAEASGGSVNIAGRPYEVIPGRGASFLAYREKLGRVDYTKCFGRI